MPRRSSLGPAVRFFHPRLALLVLVVGSLVASCGNDSRQPVLASGTGGPTLPPAPTECVELVAESPAILAGQGVRSSPLSNSVRSWGDPPIVLRCGVPRPSGFTSGSQLFAVNGVSWFVLRDEDVAVYTAVDRVRFVEVRVPADYAGATVLADLAGVVGSLAQRSPVPRRSADRSKRSMSAG